MRYFARMDLVPSPPLARNPEGNVYERYQYGSRRWKPSFPTAADVLNTGDWLPVDEEQVEKCIADLEVYGGGPGPVWGN